MTTADSGKYLFTVHESDEELRRLQLIEQSYDRYSQARLLAAGLGNGAHCLEAGVGAGSMARWMARQAGLEGRVIGVDMDDRFFPLTEGSGVELITQDIRTVQIADESLDFVHARCFFMHLPDRAEILDRMVRWLKPGGSIVIADFDSPDSKGVGPLNELWREVTRRIIAAVQNVGGDPFAAGRHDRLFLNAGLTNIEVDSIVPFVIPGGTKGQLLQSSLEMIRKICDLSDLPTDDLDALSESIPTGEFVHSGYVLVVAEGQRPA